MTVCYVPAPVALNTASGRFRFRVLDILRARNQKQKTLKGRESASALSMKMRGFRGISLDDAAEIADALGFPLAELVSAPDSSFYDLNAKEQRIIDAYRQLGKDEQDAFLTTVTLRQRPGPNQAGRRVAKKPLQSAHGGSSAARPSALSEHVHGPVAHAADAIDAAIAWEQAASPRAGKSAASAGHRGTGRSSSK